MNEKEGWRGWVGWEEVQGEPVLMVLNPTPAVLVPHHQLSWPSRLHSVCHQRQHQGSMVSPPVNSSCSSASFCCHWLPWLSATATLSSSYMQVRSWAVLNFSIFSKFPGTASEYVLCYSLDNYPRVCLRTLRLALLTCWPSASAGHLITLLGLWYTGSLLPCWLKSLPALATSFSSLASWVLLWILSSMRHSRLDAEEGTRNLVQTPPGKAGLGEFPNRTFKRWRRWKYKQMWQKGREKQKKHSYNIHLPRTEYIGTE